MVCSTWNQPPVLTKRRAFGVKNKHKKGGLKIENSYTAAIKQKNTKKPKHENKHTLIIDIYINNLHDLF